MAHLFTVLLIKLIKKNLKIKNSGIRKSSPNETLKLELNFDRI